MSKNSEKHAKRCAMKLKSIRALACEYASGVIDTAQYRQQRKQLIEEFAEMQLTQDLSSKTKSSLGKNAWKFNVNANTKKNVILVVSILALFLLAFLQSPFLGD